MSRLFWRNPTADAQQLEQVHERCLNAAACTPAVRSAATDGQMLIKEATHKLLIDVRNPEALQSKPMREMRHALHIGIDR